MQTLAHTINYINSWERERKQVTIITHVAKSWLEGAYMPC